jgi:hypothetical protein
MIQFLSLSFDGMASVLVCQKGRAGMLTHKVLSSAQQVRHGALASRRLSITLYNHLARLSEATYGASREPADPGQADLNY